MTFNGEICRFHLKRAIHPSAAAQLTKPELLIVVILTALANPDKTSNQQSINSQIQGAIGQHNFPITLQMLLSC